MKIREMYFTEWRHIYAVEMLDGQMMCFLGSPERVITEADLEPLPKDTEVTEKARMWEDYGFTKEENIKDFRQGLKFLVEGCQGYCDSIQERFPEMLATDTGRKWAWEAVRECEKILGSFGGRANG